MGASVSVGFGGTPFGDAFAAAARSLVTVDGLHANALGTWYLLHKLDGFIEARLPGTPKDALVFSRPPPGA